MGFIFFPDLNRINGKYVNVFGMRYDLKKVREDEIRANDKTKKRVFNSEEDFAKYCDLRLFSEVKRKRK